MKLTSVVVWSLVCLLLFLLIMSTSFAAVHYEGDNFVFQTNDNWGFSLIAPESEADIEIAASEFFVLRNTETGQILAGNEITAPLGWQGKSYFYVSVLMESGEWLVEQGDEITCSVTSARSIELVATIKPRVLTNSHVLITLLFLVIWLFIVSLLLQ